MKYYICDVCGEEIPLGDRYRAEKSPNIQKMVGDTKDVCPRCRLVGAALDPAAILLDAWKSQVKRAG